MFSFAPENRQRRAVLLPPLGTHLDLHSAGDVGAGQRVGLAHDFFGRAMRHQAAAVTSRAGAEVDYIIGAANRFFVVLDHQHGVAQVAQIFERRQQAAVVAMMQADRRLVEHVEHAAQLRANLRGQTNALAFAAGKRRRRAVERNVIQSHGIQELQTLDHFVHDAPGDLFFAPRQLDASRHFERPRNRQRREFGDRHAVHLHRQALRPQPLAVARRTFRRRHVIHQPVAVAFRSRLFEILFQVSEDSAEARLAAARLAVQQQILNLLGKLFKRSVQIDAVRRRRNLQGMNQSLRRRTGPEAAIEQRLRPVGDHLRRIEIVAAAEPVTLGTSSIHAVERKRARLELRHADAAIRTGQLLGIKLLFAADHGDLHQAARQLHRQADRHFQAMLNARLHQQTVDHDFDGVILALVEIEVVIQVDEFAIDTGAGVAVLEQRLHFFLELALATADDRRQHHDAVFGSQSHHPLHDLFGRLAADRPARTWDNAALRSRRTRGEDNRRFR